MEAVFQDILNWVNAHQALSLALVFVIAAGESLAIIGTLVPGVSVMLLAGALAGLGVLDLPLALLSAAAGAIIGDGLSFWLGKRYRHQLTNLWPLRRYPGLIPRGEAFFLRHGGKSILFGRFFGPVRAIIPAVAGIMDMSALRFYSVNIVSALLWAPATILPGVAFGAALSVAAEVASRLVVMIVLLLACTWLLFLLIHFIYRHLAPQAEALTLRMLDLAHRHPHIGPVIGAVIDPQERELRGLLILSLLLVLASTAWFTMLALQSENLYFPMDALIHGELSSLRMPWLHHLTAPAIAMTRVPLLLIAVAAAAVLLWLQHYRSASLHLLGATALACIIPWSTSLFVSLPESSSDFLPDLSLTLVTTLTGIFIVMTSRSLPPAWRWLPWSLCGILLLLISAAFAYQFHTLVLDTAGALGLGLTLTALVGIAWRRHHRQVLPKRTLVGVGAALLLIPAAGLPMTYPPLPAVTSPGSPVLSEEQWLARPRAILEKDRSNHPISLQWAIEDIGSIATTLAARGWQTATPLDWSHGLRWFQAEVPAIQLPVTPHVWNGFFPLLTLTRPGASDEEIEVLRLWHSGARLDSGEQILVGNITVAVVTTRTPWFRYLVTRPAGPEVSRRLQDTLATMDKGIEIQRKNDLLLIRMHQSVKQ